MRGPPDKRQGPRRPPADARPDRKIFSSRHPNECREIRQHLCAPRCIEWGSQPTDVVAARLRDDGSAPIGVRVLAAQAAHRMASGGCVSAEDERRLQRLHAQRRRQLADALQFYQ